MERELEYKLDASKQTVFIKFEWGGAALIDVFKHYADLARSLDQTQIMTIVAVFPLELSYSDMVAFANVVMTLSTINMKRDGFDIRIAVGDFETMNLISADDYIDYIAHLIFKVSVNRGAETIASLKYWFEAYYAQAGKTLDQLNAKQKFASKWFEIFYDYDFAGFGRQSAYREGSVLRMTGDLLK